eukprot:TRINITY_DN4728_c0_g1_i1.p1 TRINITY_DN4728_c0_g1~~TRINITY_DN4728_c0_g1_i1.p1  ORF type:complete len:216 (+),score=37.62 TRINITY_DN4728_c0_g1_i1:714-1361(+)
MIQRRPHHSQLIPASRTVSTNSSTASIHKRKNLSHPPFTKDEHSKIDMSGLFNTFAQKTFLPSQSTSDIDSSSYTSFSSDSVTRGGDEESERLLGNTYENQAEDEEGKWLDFTVQELNFEINKQIGRVRGVSMAVPLLPLPWTIIHPIDRHSPLRNATPQSLAAARTEIVAIVDGISEAVSDNFQARWSYIANEIVWGAEFVPMVKMEKGMNTRD